LLIILIEADLGAGMAGGQPLAQQINMVLKCFEDLKQRVPVH